MRFIKSIERVIYVDLVSFYFDSINSNRINLIDENFFFIVL